MATGSKRARLKKVLIYTAVIVVVLVGIIALFADRIVEPVVRKRLHTLIIQGSDSLYRYTLGDVKVNVLGGNVELRDLKITVDSNHYRRLRDNNRLPSLTMELNLQLGRIRGISLTSMLLSKAIRIDEIHSTEADIRLIRHLQRAPRDPEPDMPLWKSIQPDIASIAIDKIRLDGVKLLYRHADTSESVKLQFDRCEGVFDDIRIDSASASDSNRIAFTKDVWLRFNDLKFRTADSTYKLKAEWITYSSRDRIFEVDSFKIQPTLETKEEFYGKIPMQRSMYRIEFAKARFTNLHLDRFINNNVIDADSVLFTGPDVDIYLDRTITPDFESKVGKYPHQQLLKSSSMIKVRYVGFRGGAMKYTERGFKTGEEGTVFFDNLDLDATNVVNDPLLIRSNPLMLARARGRILGEGAVDVAFKFFLDSANGRYEANGSINSISAASLNKISLPLANVQLNSFDVRKLDFFVTGDDFEAWSNVKMRYNNLSLTLRKKDEETGEVETKKFLTKILNKFVIHPDNPGPDGVERVATGSRVSRLTTQSFFGLLWKAIFAGMQDVMMKSGRV